MSKMPINENSPIFTMQQDKESILTEVTERSLEKLLTDNNAEFVLNDSAYKELLRLSKRHPQRSNWEELYSTLNRIPEHQQKETLRRMIRSYAEDIIGRFDPKVYRFATSMIPAVLGVFLDPQLTLRHRNMFQEKVMIEGNIEAARKLSEKGTVILVPTHSSNMDSMLVGWSAFRSGLPPVTYGAGINLFTNKVLSFFMHNLGAYRLDRRLQHEAYKTTLKTYSLVILERGFHSLFFPGGTRSRSGAIEQKLKLGLMGTGLEAYINNLKNKVAKPNIYLVPITMNYFMVLEAETLINDYLKEKGKSRYIIEDDESSKFIKTYSYMKKTLDLDASVSVRYGPPLDIFGNHVDEEGLSYDDQGRVIDPSLYVKNWQGEVDHESNRDREYTREVGEKIAQIYQSNNVVLSPHIVSYTLFRYLVFCNPRLDLYELIRMGAREAQIKRGSLIVAIDRFKSFLARQQANGVLRLGTTLSNKPADMILEEAMYYLNMFYSKDVILSQGETLQVQDMRLLYYYHNRLSTYQFEKPFIEEILQPLLSSEDLAEVN